MSEKKSNFGWTNLDSSMNFNYDIFDINSRHINKIKEQSISQGAKLQFNHIEDPYSNYNHFNIDNTINFTDLQPKNYINTLMQSSLHHQQQNQPQSSYQSIQAPSQIISRKGLKNLASLLLKILLKKQFSSHKEVSRQIQKLFIKSTIRNKQILKEQKNIRRRIYDALNVMIAVQILTKQQQTISFRHHSPLNSRNYSIINKKDEYYDEYNQKKRSIQSKKQLLSSLQDKLDALSWWISKKRPKKHEKHQPKLYFPLIFVMKDSNCKMHICMSRQQLFCKGYMEIYSQTDIFQYMNKQRIERQSNQRTAIKLEEYIQIEFV